MSATTSTTTAAKQAGSEKIAGTADAGFLLGAALLVLLFAGLLGLWHCFDHALPQPDDSSYILSGFKYADLLRHPKFWHQIWWHNMLTVDRAYPPAALIFSGVCRLLLGAGNWVNVFSVMAFGGLLTGTVYGATRLLTGDRRASLIAAVLINLYPEATCMSHGFALDFPLMSMISAGLCSLFWWRSSPTWRRAIGCGAVLGAACLTKQIAAAYLILPGFYCLAEAIIFDLKQKRFQRSGQLVVVAGITIAIGLPWLLTNLSFLRQWANDNQSNMGHLTVWQVFPQRIGWYARSLPTIMSPLLCACLAISLFASTKVTHRRLLPVGLSAVGGVLLISTLTWAFPSLRYDAPAMIAAAIYTGCAMSRMLNNSVSAIVAGVLLSLGALQYVSFNFAPYPISYPSAITRISELLGVNLVETFGLTERDRRVSQIRHSDPAVEQDWGQEWAIRTIDRVEGHKSVYLNILPDVGTINGNTFTLVARMLGSAVSPTTSRRWTVMGDRVVFDPKVAMYYQWYLLKSGYQGNLLRDEQSERDYARLYDFVQHSGNFKLAGTHEIADGSTISLYRQR